MPRETVVSAGRSVGQRQQKSFRPRQEVMQEDEAGKAITTGEIKDRQSNKNKCVVAAARIRRPHVR